MTLFLLGVLAVLVGVALIIAAFVTEDGNYGVVASYFILLGAALLGYGIPQVTA